MPIFFFAPMKSKNHIPLLPLLFLSLSLNAIQALNNGPNPLVLNCGSPNAGEDADGRKWQPDDEFLITGDKAVAAKAETQDPSLPSDIPYMTARIFPSEGTYQFPLQNSTSRTLLRLHFYPSSYPNFNISNSYFSVIAGGVTLLNNFSASLAAEALSQAYFIKEYYLAPSELPTLNVTFKPSDKQPQSFGFVNGIEVISSPMVFDEEPILAGSAGSGNDFQAATTVPIDTNSLETMYRLNVGGQYIAPTNDSGGLMRSWYDDSLYIYGAGHGVAVQANITVGYKGLPTYIAPLDVYRTYRSMGAFVDVNKNSNLTWVFQVDPNFMYLIRFHWCDSEMTKINQRVFDVYINNKTAASEMDIFAWTNSIATPIKKDFVVHVSNKADSDTQLWVALHPNDKTKAEFADVLLNGLEIFKLSDNGKSNLAGPNPTLSDLMKKYQEAQMAPKSFETPNESSSSTVVITGAAGGAAAVGIAAVIFLVAYNRKKRVPGGDSATSWLPISWNSNSTTTKSVGRSTQGGVSISTDAASNCRYFSLAEIKNATKNFDESNVIGVGGFGKVYKGIIDSDMKVAIKRSNPSSEQGVHEFQTEIEMLSQLRHRHLVSLIGFCEDNGEMILVYDYMGKGTLREHLYKGNKIILTWKQRLEICIGAARGLHYLHTGAKYTIIHRDVKTTNILVDDKWVAKVSDFGLSKTGPNMNKGHVSTVVKGSFGYLDPEYFRRQQLTEKSDVYSFGVVLFEVLCARPALNPSLPKEQVSLADWALRCARNKTLEDIIDPQLKGKIAPECLKKFAETAEKCLADHGVDRPTMGDVLWSLESALQIQDNFESGRSNSSSSGSMNLESVEEEVIDHNSLIAMHRSTLSLGEDDDVEVNKSSASDNTEDVFSLFVNQQGR
ncbi:Serine/threonine protein kinase [Handroanthus impetiginosus]|uniref:non-specific serine/threonine protein kinase n=1 Tax=Handroanthus impetiginosus TaxID=429701 RepID=A0A2G9GJ77_9LAMI|nr:Serine/threonine protein kinase [Handroanthus impetiginosus]